MTKNSFVRTLTLLLIAMMLAAPALNAQERATGAGVWVPDNGDGTYTNPIIYADYSDPDVIRVGDDFYLVSSSFSHFPGLPILHSKDLLNWTIVGHAAPKYSYEEFNQPQHGMAIWAPSLRYHNGEYYIYFGDPDRGVFMTKTKNPAGPWEPLRLIRKATGWIDTCPLWDDDGRAYLVHAWANSRVGIKSILVVNRMNKEGTEILDDSIVVFDGHANHPTIEGPKFYKRNGYYYIFAPAGGVKTGWQTVLRSKNVFGPYEDKKVLQQGNTKINGPHQGAWIDTQTGEHWFVHFQDRYAYGRIIHLQPMRWVNDWPVIGKDFDEHGIGEPVLKHQKPDVGKTFSIEVLQTSDEFDAPDLGLQWQWEANGRSEWTSLDARKGWLRLYSEHPSAQYKNLWNIPSLMLQKMPASRFTATAKIDFAPRAVGERTGLVIFGLDYSYVGLIKKEKGYEVSQVVCTKADKGTKEEIMDSVEVISAKLLLRVDVWPENDTTVIPRVLCRFSYSVDGKNFHSLGETFTAREGLWVGAKVGVFALASETSAERGYCDIDWFRVGKLNQ